jgi:nucleoid-associated protein YgaU
MLAHKLLGDGSRYKEIYALNKDVIDAGNKGTGNSVYTIYAGQVFKLP